jgi:thymidylate synthase (FAD)
MDKIEVKIWRPETYKSMQLMVGSARLTQRAEKIHNMSELEALFNKSVKTETMVAMSKLPHNNIRCFGTITMFVVGASRRFLAQITRRRIGVTFCSGSLQYSDWSEVSGEQFTIPYEILKKDVDRYGYADLEQGYYSRNFINTCQDAMHDYKKMVSLGLNNDTAGYVAPQALRNILIIDATPQAWIEMIKQRICKRNTDETRYVLLRCWEQLYNLDPIMFAPSIVMPNCYNTMICPEGAMTCGSRYKRGDTVNGTPTEIIDKEFPAIRFINDLNNYEMIQEEDE